MEAALDARAAKLPYYDVIFGKNGQEKHWALLMLPCTTHTVHKLPRTYVRRQRTYVMVTTPTCKNLWHFSTWLDKILLFSIKSINWCHIIVSRMWPLFSYIMKANIFALKLIYLKMASDILRPRQRVLVKNVSNCKKSVYFPIVHVSCN